MTSYHVEPISSFPKEDVLGIGRSGVVVRQGQAAVKSPLRWSISSPEQIEANIESIQHEQAIYHRLAGCEDVVPVLDHSETTTSLRLIEHGDLHSFLQKNSPSRTLQLSWFRSMARALAQVHERKVIVADIATRNFLLDAELKLKICDFTESFDMPLDTSMETADVAGYSIHTDIGQLGAVMYEVVVGEKCEFDIFSTDSETGTWPLRKDLPKTAGIWLGTVIEKCWAGAFKNAHELDIKLESEQVV